VTVPIPLVGSRISIFVSPQPPREVAKRFPKTLSFFILATALIIAPFAWAQQKNAGPSSAGPRPNAVRPYVACAAAMPAVPPRAQQKPFTQEQVSSMVRDGFGDESGAKLIEQRGIDFAPSEDFYQTLKAAGASEAFLNALRAAKPPEPASAKKPLNQVQVFALLVGQVPSHRVTMLVEERGIDFEPTDDYLQEVRLAGGEDELVSALKNAKVMKPATVDPAAQARQAEVRKHVARGGEFYQKQQLAQAVQEFRSAAQLDPQNADLQALLSCTFAEQRRWDEAISAAQGAVRLDPNDDLAHTTLAFALGGKGDRDGEITEYREALRLNPNNELAHANLGVALGNKGDWDEEITEEREALRLNPNNDMAHTSIGIALRSEGDLDGAIAQYREALRLNPDNDLAHFNLGSALQKKSDWDGAVAELREALRLNPKNETAHIDLGAAFAAKGDWDGEIAEFREALRLNPMNENAHMVLATALGERGDWDGATAEYHEVLRLNPNNASAHFNLGLALELRSDRRGALEEYRAACTLDPTDTLYKQRYERLLHRVKK